MRICAIESLGNGRYKAAIESREIGQETAIESQQTGKKEICSKL